MFPNFPKLKNVSLKDSTYNTGFLADNFEPASTFGYGFAKPDEGLAIEKTNTAPLDYDSVLKGEYKSDKIIFNTPKGKIIHYRYKNCNEKDLVADPYIGERVHKKCYEAYKKMKEAAQKEGVNLKIISGYRSSEYQKTVFKKKFHNGHPSEEQMNNRAKWSAPSGFSEHHTGYAIDLNSTESEFGNTKEYKWLKEHAQEYGFEQSFPENNAQGVGTEPWHWRYVGDETGKKLFQQARGK